MSRYRINILTFLLIVPIITYLFFYANSKFYWHDEVSFFLHLSGYSSQELVTSLYDGKLKTQTEIRQFQGVNFEHGLDKTLELVAKNSSHQPPLYMTLLWLWAKVWGNSEMALRSLSIIIWGIFLTIVYQLSYLLSNNRKMALLSSLLIGISPRFLNYALDVWEYGLFSLLISLSSYLFLKNLHSPSSVKNWIYYSISLIAGFYTHIFFGLVLLIHSLYLWVNRFYYSQQQKQLFIKTVGISVLLFIPWLFVIYLNKQLIYSWSRGTWQLSIFWNNLLRDFYGLFTFFYVTKEIYYLILISLLAILIISLGILIKIGSRGLRSFLMLMITVPLGTLLLLDILGSSKYSYVGRFYLPTLMGILITLAFAITQMLNRYRWRWLGFGILILLLGLGLQSQWMQFSTPHYMGYGSHIINTSLIINQSNKPIIIGEKWLDMIPLSYQLKPDARYLFVNEVFNFSALSQIRQIKPSYVIPAKAGIYKHLEEVQITEVYKPNLASQLNSEVYVLTPSKKLVESLKLAGFNLEKTEQKPLWKITIVQEN